MKKTLIALATAAVATGAFAQSNVTISGTLDFNAIASGKVTTKAAGETAEATTKTSATGGQNTWTTGQIVISGVEDLGGGLKAGFTINTGVAGSSSVGDRDRNVSLAGDFGTVRLGRFVPAAAVGFHSFSGAASTGVGSIYGLATGGTAASVNPILNYGDGATGSAASLVPNLERQDNVVQYTSPNLNGFTVNVNYGNSSSDASGTAGKAQRTQSGVHVAYTAGALSVGFGTQDRKIKTEAAIRNTANTADLIAANSSVKADLDWVGASYNFGVATVFGTHAKRKDKGTTAGVTTTVSDIKLNSVGVSVPVGAFTLAASTYTGKNKQGDVATDDLKLSGHQLSLRYAMSKRTTIYALMGKNEIKRETGITEATRKVTGHSVGLLHTF